MLSNPNFATEIEDFRFVMGIMIFAPVFFIVFYIPHPIFAILSFLKVISKEGYAALQTVCIVLLSILFAVVNTYAYYRVKRVKKFSNN